MGYDISYHPISQEEMKEWYFDRLPEVGNRDNTYLEALGRQRGMDEFYIQKYADTMKVAADTGNGESFEKTHAYYMAVVQGFFGTYYYTRGTSFSFLVDENPEMRQYILSWNRIKPADILCPVTDTISENYSGGVYIGADQVKELLASCEKMDQAGQVISDFFEQNYPVFLKALEAAAEHRRGLLEATEVVEPQPLDLSETTSFSNLMNCDKEGALIYQKTTLKQLEAFAADRNIETPGPKKSIWKKIFKK